MPTYYAAWQAPAGHLTDVVFGFTPDTLGCVILPDGDVPPSGYLRIPVLRLELLPAHLTYSLSAFGRTYLGVPIPPNPAVIQFVRFDATHVPDLSLVVIGGTPQHPIFVPSATAVGGASQFSYNVFVVPDGVSPSSIWSPL